MDGLAVDGTSVLSTTAVIIDTGTTIMYGPPASVKTFYAAIPGSEVYDSANGYYSYPCNSLPTVAFSWGGNSWTVTSAK